MRHGDSELSEAIGRTMGIQPWRRIFHAGNGSLVVLAVAVLGLPVPITTVLLGVLLAVAVLMDAIRLFDPRLNVLFFRAFASLASPREAQKIASSTWYILSALVVFLFFPVIPALAGILVLAWADPAASVVGQKWGKTRFLAGSVRGTATFFGVAFLALILFTPWWVALTTAALAAVVEAAPLDLDDNLLVPLTVAISVFFLTG
jgi:dolichol kinase